MKVERPRARLSDAPTRLNKRSTRLSRAAAAGTKLPACARMTISAFWRRKVDLPPILGPVTNQRRLLLSSKQSFETKKRKSVEEGKGGSVRLDMGGSRILKKKK